MLAKIESAEEYKDIYKNNGTLYLINSIENFINEHDKNNEDFF